MLQDENISSRREFEKHVIEEGTNVWRQKKAADAAREVEEKRQLRLMLKTYNPWGKPGNGAPMPGAIRKSKLILDCPDISESPTSALTLGRPGHGAPLRSSSGRARAGLHFDPAIRFQFNEQSRRSVDNQLRYRSSAEEKENYRRQLDTIVAQKKQQRKGQGQSQTPSNLERAKQRQHCHHRGPWGRPGPGGRVWREPRLQGYNFLRSLGWSNEATLRRLPKQEAEQMYEISGGVELVPLLAKHRASPRRPLPTTDITRMSKILNGPPKPALTEAMYHNELTSQVHQRQQKIQEARVDEAKKSQQHFDTWKGLWGRPGHGAPKGSNLAKEKLDVILYHMPSRRLSAIS